MTWTRVSRSDSHLDPFTLDLRRFTCTHLHASAKFTLSRFADLVSPLGMYQVNPPDRAYLKSLSSDDYYLANTNE